MSQHLKVKSVNPKVIVTRTLPKAVEKRLVDLFDTQLNTNDIPLSCDEMKRAVQEAEVLVPTVTDMINADIINAAGPQLRLIANYGAGTDHIDIKAAHERGVVVTNTPGVLTEDTADFAMALILAVSRKVLAADKLTRDGGFKGWAPTGILGHRVRGKKLGIIGMGRIGQAVARRAHAFGLDVHYHNPKPVSRPIEQDLQARYWADLDAMLTAMDIISINCPSTPQTHHLMSARRLALMPRHGVLVNTSRGDIIDEAALAKALKEGKIAGAGLDVYEYEPKIHKDLLGLSNVILAPHIASATHESRMEMGEKVMINIRALFDGHHPPDRVLPPKA